MGVAKGQYWWQLRRWQRALVVAVGLAACLAATFAVFGYFDGWVGGLGGPVGVWLVQRSRNADYRRLTPDQRRAVDLAVGTGIPSGDPAIDAIAQRQLAYRSRGGKANQIVSAVVFGAVLALPIIAAVARNPLWVFALVPWLAAWPEPWRAISVDPNARVQVFEAAYPSKLPRP